MDALQIRLPAPVEAILSSLRDAGYVAYAVGGCVRDSLLSKSPNDWDITTSAHPWQTAALPTLHFSVTPCLSLHHPTPTFSPLKRTGQCVKFSAPSAGQRACRL
jgi:tRNA nucleotidyltransferase (CCA-adding enzyme)